MYPFEVGCPNDMWRQIIDIAVRVSARKKFMGGTPARRRRALSGELALPQKIFISGPPEMRFPSI